MNSSRTNTQSSGFFPHLPLAILRELNETTTRVPVVSVTNRWRFSSILFLCYLLAFVERKQSRCNGCCSEHETAQWWCENGGIEPFRGFITGNPFRKRPLSCCYGARGSRRCPGLPQWQLGIQFFPSDLQGHCARNRPGEGPIAVQLDQKIVSGLG